MAQVNRERLKEYFRSGSRPTEEEFVSLIDSVPNVIDDGAFRKEKGGWVFYPAPDGSDVMQIFDGEPDAERLAAPLWRVGLGKEGALLVRNGEGKALLDVGVDGTVGLSGDLRIGGRVLARSFLGRCGLDGGDGEYGFLPADGCWQTVPLQGAGERDGCRVYRVCAGCGDGAKNRYALLEAVVMHTCGKKRKIKRMASWTGWRINRLRIRWQKTGDGVVLQLRTARNYGAAVIRYQVTEVWGDYWMNGK